MARRNKLLEAKLHEPFREQIETIAKMISGLIVGLRKQ
jgi:hypothetical protein